MSDSSLKRHYMEQLTAGGFMIIPAELPEILKTRAKSVPAKDVLLPLELYLEDHKLYEEWQKKLEKR